MRLERLEVQTFKPQCCAGTAAGKSTENRDTSRAQEFHVDDDDAYATQDLQCAAIAERGGSRKDCRLRVQGG